MMTKLIASIVAAAFAFVTVAAPAAEFTFSDNTQVLRAGSFASGNLFANSGSGSAIPTASVTPSAWLDRWCGSTQNQFLQRGSSNWACVSPGALTKTDDTNVTLTLGGAPTSALLGATSLTLGWTGTLAAARLNSNVVQGVTNDTNVTGAISSQNLTFGWTGQLAVSRGGTGDSGTAWSTYTPTITCGTGSASTSYGRYKAIGKTVFITITVNNGTCATSISASLPVNAADSSGNNTYVLNGVGLTTGTGYWGNIGSAGSTVSIKTYSNGFPDSTQYTVSGIYESQ